MEGGIKLLTIMKLIIVGSNPTPARDTLIKPPRGVSWVTLID